MKKITFYLAPIALVALVYPALVFTKWSFDVSCWGQKSRGVFVLISLLVLVIWGVFGVDHEADYRLHSDNKYIAELPLLLFKMLKSSGRDSVSNGFVVAKNLNITAVH